MPCCYCSAIVNNSVSAWKITKPVLLYALKPEVSDLYSYKAPYIAQSMKPSCASTDTPTFRVIKSSATEASSKWHACMVCYSRLWICYMMKSTNRAFLAALDRRTRPLIVSNCLAKLGAVEVLYCLPIGGSM